MKCTKAGTFTPSSNDGGLWQVALAGPVEPRGSPSSIQPLRLALGFACGWQGPGTGAWAEEKNGKTINANGIADASHFQMGFSSIMNMIAGTRQLSSASPGRHGFSILVYVIASAAKQSPFWPSQRLLRRKRRSSQ